MKITISPTAQLIDINGVQCRVWTGANEYGTRCDLFIARVVISKDEPAEAQAVFERELTEKRPPATATNVWPARMILP